MTSVDGKNDWRRVRREQEGHRKLGKLIPNSNLQTPEHISRCGQTSAAISTVALSAITHWSCPLGTDVIFTAGGSHGKHKACAEKRVEAAQSYFQAEQEQSHSFLGTVCLLLFHCACHVDSYFFLLLGRACKEVLPFKLSDRIYMNKTCGHVHVLMHEDNK